MVTELSKRLVIVEPIVETVLPTFEVLNIWAFLVDKQTVKTEVERDENKRKNK